MDNDYHPGDFNCGCKMGEQSDGCSTPGNCSAGACEPCPETAGSDCSRCDNGQPHPWGRSTFPEPCDNDCMRQTRSTVLDVVKVPKVKPGKYVVCTSTVTWTCISVCMYKVHFTSLHFTSLHFTSLKQE
jgi:hypothetical protein